MKTLKDFKYSRWDFCDEDNSGDIVSTIDEDKVVKRKDLKQEAIMWMKHYLTEEKDLKILSISKDPNPIIDFNKDITNSKVAAICSFIICFFNIEKEDLE